MVNFKNWIVLGGLGVAVAGGSTGCAQMHEREARNTGRTELLHRRDAMIAARQSRNQNGGSTANGP